MSAEVLSVVRYHILYQDTTGSCIEVLFKVYFCFTLLHLLLGLYFVRLFWVEQNAEALSLVLLFVLVYFTKKIVEVIQ